MHAVVILSMLASAPAAASPPPNVVLILADDVGCEAFGCYGSDHYSTPVLDRMAREGVRFAHAYSLPLCTPSRVALMTGKSNVRNYVDFGALTPNEYTFAKLFRDAGYTSAAAGKWQLQGSKNAAGTPPADAGFDTYCLWNTPTTQRARYWNPSIERDGELLELPNDSFGPDVFTDFLVQFLEENQDRPFFVYYPMVLVHSPFVPTPASPDRASNDKRANFTAMVSHMDSVVGRIVAAIERLDLSDRTILIFTSDNGTHSDIRSALHGRTVRGAKGTTCDNGNHVPLIVRVPEAGGEGRVIDDLIDFSDFLPTLADIIGTDLPGSVKADGRSFWPQVLGQPGNPRDWIFTYYFPRPYAEHFDHPYRHPEVRFAQDRRFKLYDDGRLFDLLNDRLEKQPLRLGSGACEAVAARQKLKSVLASFPQHGALLPKETYQR